MAAASRSSYQGAAVFGGAAAISGMLAMMIWVPLRPDLELGVWLSSVIRTGFSAAISAALSFTLLNWMGWRLRRGSSLARAAVLGIGTVVGAHLLVGFVYAIPFAVETIVLTDRGIDVTLDLIAVPIIVSLYSTLWILVILPAGIAAAALVELLERREAAQRVKAQ